MDAIDATKTTCMSNHCNYYYNLMPFRLKNANAAYKRLMYGILSKQIGHILEVYIDDIIIKTSKVGRHAKYLEDNMGSIRSYNMHLNPAKCSFGV